uniref:Uncharacterized protein n=1 Tax=Aegilops tauschii subsp. strangulata TaxID=200361 RepID=A0A453CWZ6_AEGTS
GDLGRSSPVSGNGGRAPLLLHPWYSSSHLSRLNDICCVAKASAAHHQHLRPRILLPLHPEARRHDGSSKGWSEEIGLGSWNKSTRGCNSCSSTSLCRGSGAPALTIEAAAPDLLCLGSPSHSSLANLCSSFGLPSIGSDTTSIIICRTYTSCRQID